MQTEILKVDYLDTIESVDDLKKYYEFVKPLVDRRMKEFDTLRTTATKFEFFRELVFCILTANASAKMALKSINALDAKIFNGNEDMISAALRGVYRFPTSRANYIVRSREFLEKQHNYMDFKSIFESHTDLFELRDYLKDNIVGIGYKECSHFLRNIGFKGFAILDKHVISMLNVVGCNVTKPRNKREYKQIEQIMKEFASKNNIDFDDLDLVFWSFKTGEIIK
jgi:N-glycosylase/DNA lyase